jgi:cyclopropane-fatty-acyl-phospholipid synthase
MNLKAATASLAERAPLPDSLVRVGMRHIITQSDKRFADFKGKEERAFAQEMSQHAVAENTDAANEQHYELPAEFFALCLGPNRKYSSCRYLVGDETLEQAEEIALATTVGNAQLEDGQNILELGCGWGSLTLYMAENYPNAKITAVSNSASQRAYIEGQAKARRLKNVHVITEDMNNFAIGETFDRIVSVEMFEHMSNWRHLLSRAKVWMKPEDKLFIHIFTHKSGAYRYDHSDKTDWIAQHFFTGGIMPSHGLIRQFSDLFKVEHEWRWSGTHYQRTAMQWLANYDANRKEIGTILRQVYGRDAILWRRRWRMFFLAVAEMFGHDDGNAWGVSHYLLTPA